MEARLQVTQTPSVLSTAPASKGASDDGFEAALADATEASQGNGAKPQAIEGEPGALSESSEKSTEPAKAEALADSSTAPRSGDVQNEGTSDALGPDGDGVEDGVEPAMASHNAAPGVPQTTEAEPADLQGDVSSRVATQAEAGRQQSASGNAEDVDVSVAGDAEQTPLTTAAETERVAAKVTQVTEGEPPKQPPVDKVDPIKGRPVADGDSPNLGAPGLAVADDAKPRRGASEPGLESRAQAATAAVGKRAGDRLTDPKAEAGLPEEKAAAPTPIGLSGGEKPAESHSAGQPSQGKADTSPFALLSQSGGEGEAADAEGEAGTQAPTSPKAVAKQDLTAPLATQAGETPKSTVIGEGKASPKRDANQEPKALSGSELLAQLQGSREVQTKLDGEPQPQKLDAASRQAMGDTAAMAQAPGTQKLVAEKLDPELAKEVSALQGAQLKAESGLRSAQATAEMTLQPQAQLQEAAPVAASAEQGDGLELDPGHRLQQGRTPEAARPAQAEAQQAAMRQPVAAERMAPELRERMMMMINSRTNQAEIRLDPPELGALQIKIQMNGDQAQVQLHTQQAQTREMVEQALPRLREMLAQQGITLADTQVSHGGGGQAGTQEGEAAGEGSALGGDGMVEASDEALVTVQQMTGRNADGGIDYYA
ncbi:flagellar hook-length control protein FliK [Ferrimonas futtsuensis]|uniref:flagellar hook-length control protein FliK n=1 Tax=Ferrimonas futtsuensis TaxID=364764 RepID=UPI000410F7D6|nr:flagellar hook-length control protein FliK [Ferrimonas futtsuensis]